MKRSLSFRGFLCPVIRNHLPIVALPQALKHQSCHDNVLCDRRSIHTSGGRRQKTTVGVFGAGNVASRVHIPNILSNHRVDLRWIVDANPEAFKALKSKLNIDVPFYKPDQTTTLLDDESLDAVLVLTPTPTHYNIILPALQKGKAVFTEKTTAETVEETKTLYDTAQRVGRPLLTGYHRRFDPAYVDIFKMLVEGEIGKLQMVKVTTRDSPRPPYELIKGIDRSGCNIISDLASHDFDFLTWVTKGSAPDYVYSLAHAHDPGMVEIGQPDVCGIMLQYPCGAIGFIDCTRESVYGYDQRVELFGSKGMATSVNPRRSFATKDFNKGALQRPMMYSYPERFREAYEKELDHFVDCVEGKATPAVSKDDCVMSALVNDAALQSYRRKAAINFPKYLSERAESGQ